MAGSALVIGFVILWILLAFFWKQILRLVVGGFRREDYATAEAKLAKRFRFLSPILSGLCLTVSHRPEVLPLIKWILTVHVVRAFRFEVMRAAHSRAIRGDRRLRAGDFVDRNIELQPTSLLRREDEPLALRLFQLRLMLYPWSS